MIANIKEVADAEQQLMMGYSAAKKAYAAHRDLGLVPYPSGCAAAAGWAKATYDIYQEHQGAQIQWFSAE